MRLTLLVVLGVFGFSGCGSESAPATSLAERESVTSTKQDDVSLEILSYDEIQQRIAAQRGKVVVLDAWSTSCAPCIKEFPKLVKLHNDLGPDKLTCISLSFDYEGIDSPEDQQDRVLRVLRQHNATFTNILNRDEADVLYKKMKIDAPPTVLVYDKSGNLRQQFDSSYRNAAGQYFTYDDVRALVEELMVEPEAS